MQVIGDKNQISEDVFDFMISYLPFPQKSIRSELAKLFSISIHNTLQHYAFSMSSLPQPTTVTISNGIIYRFPQVENFLEWSKSTGFA